MNKKVLKLEERILYDITTERTAIDFLVQQLETSFDNVYDCIKKNLNLYNIDDLLEDFGYDIDSFDLEKVDIVSVHVTTNWDKCMSLKKLGLLNLRQSLAMETPLKQFFESIGVEFDIYNNFMIINNQFYELNYDRTKSFEVESLEGKLNAIARKIYYDYQVNGFLCTDDYKGYGGCVHIRPEIVYDVAKIFKNTSEIERFWVDQAKPYVIKYKAGINSYDYSTFYDSKEDYKKDYSEGVNLRKWLFNQAYYVIKNKIEYGNLPSEMVGYLKREVYIPHNDIIEINPI